MGLSINQNIMAMNSYRNLSSTQTGLSKSLEKLSSGYRINRAADDAAGLAISEGLRAQVKGNQQAVRNAQDGISLIQTTEGAMNEMHALLQRGRQLAVQGLNGTNSADNQSSIRDEIDQIGQELKRIATNTNFNGKAVLGGNAGAIKFQVGANGSADNQITVTTKDMTTSFDKIIKPGETGTDGIDWTKPADTLKVFDDAIKLVSDERSKLGAMQNRFESTINNLNVAVENLSASESRIRDTDMASEMMQFTRNQILSQAGTSMLAQANQVPQGVLSLLR